MMSTVPPDAPGSPGQPRYVSTQPPATQVILQQPPSAFGRYGKLLIAALIFCILTIAGQAASYRSYFSPPGGPQERYHSLSESASKKIAIIKIEGAILDAEGFVKQQIDLVRKDDDVAAVVLRIDSPGGTVTASDYLYHHLLKVTDEEKLPIVVSMGGICASGGYYLAMAAGGADDVIYAEPTTWTGSIGVLIPHYDLSGLLARWDVTDDSVASNKDKLMGSPTRALSPEEKAEERKLLQELVDRSFERFKNIVRKGRPKLESNAEHFAEATTGQIFTSEQAEELGLVDKIGFIDDAVARAAELAKLDVADVRAVQYDEPPNTLRTLLGAESPLAPTSRGADLRTLLDLTAPRAYYICTWLPSLLGNSR
jgi:protease-4